MDGTVRIKTLQSATVEPPRGGFIHEVQVAFTFSHDWSAAILAAAPHTPQGRDIFRVENFYSRPGGSPEIRACILVSFGSRWITTEEMEEWGRARGRVAISPWHLFEIVQKRDPARSVFLQGHTMTSVISPISCYYAEERRVCGVWFERGKEGAQIRKAGLDYCALFLPGTFVGFL